MRFLVFICMVAGVAAGAAQTHAMPEIPEDATWVWICTTVNGVEERRMDTFVQTRFVLPRTVAAAVPRGAVGLGTITGLVGTVRAYETVTVL